MTALRSSPTCFALSFLAHLPSLCYTRRSTVADLLALRKLKQAEASAAGIDIAKLNSGDSSKKRKRPAAPSSSSGARTEKDLVPGLRESGGNAEDGDDDPDSSSSRARRMVQTNNFTQQTNMIDVDKHMMAFIEAELKKRRKAAGVISDFDAAEEMKALDPRDALYSIAEKYKVAKTSYAPLSALTPGSTSHLFETGSRKATSRYPRPC